MHLKSEEEEEEEAGETGWMGSRVGKREGGGERPYERSPQRPGHRE